MMPIIAVFFVIFIFLKCNLWHSIKYMIPICVNISHSVILISNFNSYFGTIVHNTVNSNSSGDAHAISTFNPL